MKKNQKLNSTHIDIIVEKIVAGQTLTSIAKELNVSVNTMLEYIDNDPSRSARVDSARRKAAKIYVDIGEQEVRSARTSFEFWKAKEIAHHLRWKAAKIAPKEFGDKVEVDNKGQIGLVVEVIDFSNKNEGE